MTERWSIAFVSSGLLLSALLSLGDSLSCPDPGTPAQGSRILISGSQFPEGTVVRFLCPAGLHLNGPPKAECVGATRAWSSSTPDCVDHCSNKCEHSGSCVATASDVPSSETTYRCSCMPGYTGDYCEIHLCLHAPSVDYASVTLIDGKQDGGHYSAGSVIQYTCGRGLQIVGNSRLTCTNAGSWSPGLPHCQRIRCTNQYNSPSHHLMNGDYSPKLPQYALGSNVSFYCQMGYVLSSSSQSYCSDTGNWLPSGWPTCQVRRCSGVSRIPNGYPLFTQSRPQVGSTVQYICLSSFHRWGPSVLRCVARSHTALWSPSQPPECITQMEFMERCEAQGLIMSSVTSSCVAKPPGNCPNCKTATQKESLTIVTAASGAFLAVLLIVVTVVACQRRRLMRRLRRSPHRPRLGSRTSSDQMGILYFSRDIHVMLPSYDEAVRTSDNSDPPPFDAALAGTDGSQPSTNRTPVTRARASNSGSSDTTEEDALYEAIDDATETVNTSMPEPPPTTTSLPTDSGLDRPNSPVETDSTENMVSSGAMSSPVIEIAMDVLEGDDGDAPPEQDSSDSVPLLGNN